MANQWPDLPDNLIDLVVELISVDLRDLVRVAAVCRKWERHIVTETRWMGYRRQIETLRLLPSLNLPKLMIPKRIGAATPMRRFIEWKTQRRFNVDLGPAQEMRCIGSGHGWLINMTLDGEMNLFNPISHEMQPLPRNPVQFQQNQGDQFVCKAIVVLMRPRTEAAEVVVCDDLWVAAIIFGQLFWVRHGCNRRWTRVAGAPSRGYICDLAHSGGLLYVINNDLSSVFVWRMTSNRCEKVFFLEMPITADLSSTYNHLKTYILEVGKEVIGVWRAMRCARRRLNVPLSNPFWYYNNSLVVLRIDRNRSWEQVNDLGDCCLFLADYTSMALSPVPPNSQFQKNCVYFTPSCSTQNIEADPSYWTVYSLNTRRCSRFHFDSSAAFRQSSSHWVTFSPITKRLPLPATDLDH